MDAIRTEKLTKRYKSLTAVDALDLTVKEGELFALLGVNGAGKSTTVKMLSCLVQPTEGDAFLCGHSVRKEAAAVKSIIGVSPQETAVAPNLTVRENLLLMCGIYGFSKEKRAAQMALLTEKLGLDTVLKRAAGKLSGGWQLIGEPRVLFLDEPTLGLDVLARSDLWELIRALKGNTTIILTTHYMEEAETLSDRIGIMQNGHLLACGTAAELKTLAGRESLEDAFVALVKGERA